MSFVNWDQDEKRLDDFVIDSSLGSIHQTSAWGKFQAQVKGRGKTIGQLEIGDDQMLGSCIAVRMKTRLSSIYWYYAARGPVFRSTQDVSNDLITEMISLARADGAAFIRFDPYFTTNGDPDFFRSLNAYKTKPALQDFHPLDTIVIDLKTSEDEILAQMSQKGRYNIGLSARRGVEIEAIPADQVSSSDMDDFWRLLSQTSTRDNFTTHPKGYYADFLHYLDQYAVLFFARFEGQRIATAISTFCGSKAIYYFGASSHEKNHRKQMPNYLLQWEMMRAAKAHGCTEYDFLGVAPIDEPEHHYAGITQFKQMFGGQRVQYQKGVDVIISPAKYALYRLLKRL